MTSHSAEVVVIGAGFAGLFAAAAAQRAGARVTVLERDLVADDVRERPGVPQGGQPHVLLHRGLIAIQSLLPGLRDELIEAGGVPIDTGDMAWLSPDGWLPVGVPVFEIVSLSRPLLELSVRRRVFALDRVEARGGVRVHALNRVGGRWQVRCDGDNADLVADVVIDASGRSSRLPHWLADLGITVPEPSVVEAKLGYATRRYRSVGERPLDVGIVLAATPETEAGALVLPIENNEWLLCEAGYGDRRPARGEAAFDAYLHALSDPVIADFAALLEPVDDIRVHRQTRNRRHLYGRVPHWPAGLLVVGDALTAFNPIYGQGITVAALQAEVLADRLHGRFSPRATARLQRRLARTADFPWAVATGEDLRYPTCRQTASPTQRAMHRWSTRVNQLAAAGDTYCRVTMGSIYHMMKPGIMLFAPRIVASVLRSLVAGVPPSVPRPAALDAALGSGPRSSVSPPPAP